MTKRSGQSPRWGQSLADAVSSYEEVGSFEWFDIDDVSFIARSYRLPDDADERSIILDYGRDLYQDNWKDIVIVCDRDGLKVQALKGARLRFVDAFTMSVTISISNGTFLADPDGIEGPKFRRGGLGADMFLSAPPVYGEPTFDIRDAPPSVLRDEECDLPFIVGNEGELLMD